MIGNIGKLVNIVNQLEPGELSKLSAAMKKDAKGNAAASSVVKSLGSSLSEIAKIMGDVNGGVNEVAKAAAAKAKPSKEDKEKMKKEAAKMAETMQATRIKMIEAKIVEAEKNLAQLRKWLESAKKDKPSNWFS